MKRYFHCLFFHCSCLAVAVSQSVRVCALGLGMKFSHLAAFVTLLVANFGEVSQHTATHLSEDCGGKGLLSAGASIFGLKTSCRDVSWRHCSQTGRIACVHSDSVIHKDCQIVLGLLDVLYIL